MNRTTPDSIDSLLPHEVFVFGSNADGQHGGGAARTANLKFGAVMGEGEGLQGQSYALPTMEGLDKLRFSAKRFIDFARAQPDLVFFLTKVGCGIAGYDEAQVKPLFAATPTNVIKPPGW